MKNPVLTLEPNTRGRDLVIGDLHGSLSALVNMLHNLNFNPEVDRVISVGDLVDRGPDSLGCLELLREPWFHATLANHEFMMLEAFDGGYSGAYWIPNGGSWGASALSDWQALYHKETPVFKTSQQVFDLLPLVREMPFLITINMTSGKKYHVLHAELPPGYNNLTDADLSSPDRVQELATTFDGLNGEAFLWSRNIFNQFHGADLRNCNYDKIKRSVQHKYSSGTGPFNDKLSHIISGHTIMQAPLTILGQTNIDTCAYGSYSSGNNHAKSWAGLTCINLAEWKFYHATETTFRESTPITVNSTHLAHS